MDRKPNEADADRRTIIILSERSREIIRLFEDLHRKRHQQNRKAAQPRELVNPPEEPD
jgi:hypothetical protein